MPRSSLLCVDASLVVPRLTQPANLTVQRLWDSWDANGINLVAPLLLRYEVTNALHRLRQAGKLDVVAAAESLSLALALPIRLVTDEDLHERAMRFAARLKLPAAYDAYYLALADRSGCELWTADRRLANTVRPALSWIHLVAL